MALLTTPLNDALMLAAILLLVVVVVMLKIAELAPAGDSDVCRNSRFCRPIANQSEYYVIGCCLFRITVPTVLEPPITDVGFKASDESVAGADAVIVSVVDLFTPEYVAVMLPRVVALTVFVFTEKFVADPFAGTVTELGTKLLNGIRQTHDRSVHRRRARDHRPTADIEVPPVIGRKQRQWSR